MSAEASPAVVLAHADVVERAREAGLVVRGAFHPEPADGVPALAGGRPAATLVLLGNVGPAMWRVFRDAPERDPAGDGLDRWSERVVGALADALGAQALFPFTGPPYLPFIRWASRAGRVWPSPIGPLVHAEHGLWHAYRGALAFPGRLALPEPAPDAGRPCDTCAEQPCMSACPVDAFGAGGYDVPRCTAHLESCAGSACRGTGCLARHACPVGRAGVYAPEQAAHHMRAFLRANGSRSSGRAGAD